MSSRHFETRSQNGAIGVDIGTRSMNVLALNQSGERLDIVAAGTVDLSRKEVQGGVVSEPKEVGRALAHFLHENEVTQSQSVISVPSSLAVLRWVNLPDLPQDDLQDAVRFKIRKHLPFPVEDAYFETSVVVRGEQLNECLAVAVPRNVIESRAETLVSAGLTPIRAELEAQAILRVVERRLGMRGALWRDASLTIIDLGSTNTHMYVVQNQRLQFIRGVKFGTARFIEMVADQLELSLAETSALMSDARTNLNERGVLSVPYEEGFALVSLSEELEKLTKEVSRLMRYFRSLHPERSYAGILDQAVLCGGLAGISGLREYLAAQLGLRVDLARPIAGMMTRFSMETFEVVSNRQEAFTVAMGLALGGVDQQQIHSGGANELDFSWTRAA